MIVIQKKYFTLPLEVVARGAMKNFAKFTGKHCFGVSFFKKLQDVISLKKYIRTGGFL